MIEIAKSDIVARLKFDNPWWDSSEKIQYEDKPRRKYFASFFEVVKDKSVRRAVVLMGPRRVGKTVMVYQAYPSGQGHSFHGVLKMIHWRHE